jgi:hypothetical protein
MAENTRIIFHIGLTKTGTTYLQKNIFPFLFQETYNYYGKPHSWHSFRGGNYVEGENNFWSDEDSWMGGEDPQRFSYKRADFWKSINYLREKVNVIDNLSLQDSQLKQSFAQDWEETWNKARSVPNVKTLDDFF